MAFDSTKPHGTIHGSKDGSKFEQNGKHYDSQGNEVGTDAVSEEIGELKRARKTVITPAPKKDAEGNDPQLDAQNQ